MKKWLRIKEVYDGNFTEMYLDLYKCNPGFVIKGTSYHYNAGAKIDLCEISIPDDLNNVKGILQFIADNHTQYPWAKISLNEIQANEGLIAFIQEDS